MHSTEGGGGSTFLSEGTGGSALEGEEKEKTSEKKRRKKKHAVQEGGGGRSAPHLRPAILLLVAILGTEAFQLTLKKLQFLYFIGMGNFPVTIVTTIFE